AAEPDVVRAELVRFGPRENLAAQSDHGWLGQPLAPDIPRLEPSSTAAEATVRRVRALAKESGTVLTAVVERAAAKVLDYAEATQPGQTLLLHRLRRHDPAEHLVLDDVSIRNLELFRTLRDGSRRGSLLWAIDGTHTSMGARML